MNLNYRQIPFAVRDRESFTGNSMHAEWVGPGGYVRTGYLPDKETTVLDHVLADAKRLGEATYIVFSYGTPIAWGMAGRSLDVPDVKYSATSSRHQSAVRNAERMQHV